MADNNTQYSNGEVLCFGEVLLRLSPPSDTSWLQQQQIRINLAGAECNVAVALAKWGMPVKYCTALPDNSISSTIIDFLLEKNIDTSTIHLSGSRVGVFYVPQGTDLKHGSLIYDRKYSSFGELQPGMIDWDKTLQGISWLHFTAINPALGMNTVAVCEEALKAAKSRGITISVDLNYRAKLWQYGKQPVEIMPALAEYCDIIMGNIWSANTLLGIPLDDALINTATREAYLHHAQQTSEAIQQRFTACKTVALTFRFDVPPQGVLYYGTVYTDGTLYTSGNYVSGATVDKVGSGDCFMAGLIFALRSGYTPAETINFASAAAFGKLHEKGDFTGNTTENIHEIITHHGSKK